MRLIDKTERYSMYNRRFVGKYKKWACVVSYSAKNYTSEESFWYFTCSKEANSYNSLWNELKYSSKEEAHDACVEYIDTQEKMATK